VHASADRRTVRNSISPPVFKQSIRPFRAASEEQREGIPITQPATEASVRPRLALPAALVAALALAVPSAASAHRHRHQHPHHPPRVHATVTLDQPTGPLLTRTPIAFTGSVSPAHAGEHVILQAQVGINGDQWRTIDRGSTDASGHYAILHRFRQAGDRSLRTVVRNDRRVLRGESTPISITVEQEQIAGFTIGASATSIDFGQSVTITGTLDNGANTSVTLYGRNELGGRFRPLAAGTTDAGGAYTFTQSPTRNAIYKVRVTTDRSRHTAALFIGVHDIVSIAPSATTAVVGETVSFTGTVQPDKTHHVIFLQRLDGGVWRSIAVGRVGPGSGYSLSTRLVAAGSVQFRTLVPGGPVNQRGVSSAVAIAVSPSPAI
jgi:hypothetical protein